LIEEMDLKVGNNDSSLDISLWSTEQRKGVDNAYAKTRFAEPWSIPVAITHRGVVTITK
jgi:hypothetical protein